MAANGGGLRPVDAISTDRVRVGVVGCGKFGGLHAAKYAEIPHAALTGVADPDDLAAQSLAVTHGSLAFKKPEDLLGRIDAVSITAPATHHYELAALFLREGVHVLVEKPLALELGHADELIALAEDNELVFQVGHQERYVVEDLGILSREVAPSSIESRRAGPFTGRATDVCAVLDLMIHDLDIIHRVIKADVAEIDAEGKAVHGDQPDEVSVRLRFDDGSTANILVSRVSIDKQRDMRLIYPDGVIEIDFLGRRLRNSTNVKLRSNFDLPGEKTGALTDPLGFGIRCFIESVQNGLPPRVSGREARRALETALMITELLAA